MKRCIDMKKTIWIIMLLGSIAFAADIGIIPTPQEVVFTGETIQLGSNVEFNYSGDPQNLGEGPNILLQALAETVDNSSDGYVLITLEKQDTTIFQNLNEDQLSEAYVLTITPQTIHILSMSDKGLFYGMMSMVQLIKASDNGRIPALTIIDYPDMAWRGISDDFSRGQVSTMRNFEEILRFLGEYKQNIYMPYMEDLIQLERYPRIGKDRGALSREDIAEMQSMAEKYFVRVIPIFQTLGHYENILSHPDFIHYAEFPGAASLNTIDAETDTFLYNMLDEVIPQFKSEYFHIGCDESRDVGFGATRDVVKRKGTARVHADHYNKVYEKVTSYGKKVMMYGDIILRHPEILNMIPKDIIIVDWHYRPAEHYPSIKTFKQAGFPFLVSPGLHNWRQSIPKFTSSWLNISTINYEGYLNGALGSINSSWGDYGGLNFRELNYMGYAFGAESSWNPDGMDGRTIRRRFLKQYFGTDDINLEALFLVSNEISKNTDLKYIFGNPFLPANNRRTRTFSSTQLLQNGEMSLKLIDRLREQDVRNKDKLDLFEIGARIGIVTGRKTALKQQLDFYVENAYDHRITDELRHNFIDECDWLVNELADIERDYRTCWLRTNRPDNLDRLMDVFRQQAAYIESAKQSIAEGEMVIDQQIPSKWIMAKAYKKNKVAAPAYLRKQFEIRDTSKIESAYLQVIAQNAAEVYINGQKLGLVASAKSGSLLAVKRQVRYWKVSDLLRKGVNTIAVKAQAYKAGQPSAANIYFEYNSDGCKTIIASDQSWETATFVNKNWQTGSDIFGAWRKALIYPDFPRQISMPLFDDGFPSQIEL